MRLKRTREVLQQFGKYVVTQSRSALTKKKKTLSGSLYDSLQYIVEDTEDGLKVSFNMNDYGKFVDKGVSGKEEKHNTPYSFTNKKPPMKPLMEWAKARSFRLRDEKGRYEKGNYKTIGFILQNSIYKKGIKPSLFFTRPFNLAYERFGDDVVKAFLKDIDELL